MNKKQRREARQHFMKEWRANNGGLAGSKQYARMAWKQASDLNDIEGWGFARIASAIEKVFQL